MSWETRSGKCGAIETVLNQQIVVSAKVETVNGKQYLCSIDCPFHAKENPCRSIIADEVCAMFPEYPLIGSAKSET